MKRHHILLAAIAALGLLFLGAALLLVGLLFRQLKWHDAFNGSVAGPVVMGLSMVGWLVFALLVALNPAPLPAGEKRLSSRLTLYVKLFLPYYLVAAWLVISIESYFSVYRHDIFLPLTLFFGVLTGLASYLALKLNVVSGNSSRVVISGYVRQPVVVKRNETQLKGSRLLAWVVADGKRHFYIPSLLGS